MSKTKKIVILTTLLYISIMGIGMAIMHFGVGYSYSEPEMVNVIVIVELLLTLLTVYTVKKHFGWKNVGFKNVNYKGFLWFLPHLLIIVYGVALWFVKLLNVGSLLSASQWIQILLVCVTTALVGFSEELMFRGIILHTFKCDGSVKKAILVSAICFSLLHSVNVLGGSPISGVAIQMALTFIMGMCFALLAIKIQNLWPLIIFHWLWDLVSITAPIIGFTNSFFTSLGILLNLTLAIILWISLRNIGAANR